LTLTAFSPETLRGRTVEAYMDDLREINRLLVEHRVNQDNWTHAEKMACLGKIKKLYGMEPA
jgi:hypothetical protein